MLRGSTTAQGGLSAALATLAGQGSQMGPGAALRVYAATEVSAADPTNTGGGQRAPPSPSHSRPICAISALDRPQRLAAAWSASRRAAAPPLAPCLRAHLPACTRLCLPTSPADAVHGPAQLGRTQAVCRPAGCGRGDDGAGRPPGVRGLQSGGSLAERCIAEQMMACGARLESALLAWQAVTSKDNMPGMLQQLHATVHRTAPPSHLPALCLPHAAAAWAPTCGTPPPPPPSPRPSERTRSRASSAPWPAAPRSWSLTCRSPRTVSKRLKIERLASRWSLPGPPHCCCS